MDRYETYKDSGVAWIGKIPEEWKVKKLKYAFGFTTGFTPPTGRANYYDGGTHAWVNISDLSKKYISSSEKNITDLALNDYQPEIVPEGSLLYSFKLTVGKVAFVEKPLYTNEAIFAILPADSIFLNFFYYSLPLMVIMNANENIYGAKILNQELIKNADLLLPPPKEQTAIANYLDRKTTEIDALIAQKQRLIELYQEEKTAVINKAVTQGADFEKGSHKGLPLRDSGIEWLGEIPEGWEVKKLKYLLQEPLKYGANESAIYDNRSHPRYIRITDFDNDGQLRKETFKSLPSEIAKDYLLSEGDILFARSGATVGKTFQFKNYNGEACFAGYLIKASPMPDLVISDYLYTFTKSSYYERWKEQIFNQATIQNIGADKYSFLSIPVPDLFEQTAIVQHIETEAARIDAKIAKTRRIIELQKEYRTALISEVVTGKIKVSHLAGKEIIS